MIELLLVLGIMGVLGIFARSAYTTRRGTAQERVTVQAFQAAVRHCQAVAQRTGSATLTIGTSSFSVANASGVTDGAFTKPFATSTSVSPAGTVTCRADGTLGTTGTYTVTSSSGSVSLPLSRFGQLGF